VDCFKYSSFKECGSTVLFASRQELKETASDVMCQGPSGAVNNTDSVPHLISMQS
jgi:hypothetical protein